MNSSERYRYRRSKGLCGRCNTPTGARALCEKHAAEDIARKSNKTLNGICQTCPSSAIDGVNCASCREKQHIRAKKKRESGFCTGCTKIYTGGGICNECKEKDRQRRKKNYKAGLCISCTNIRDSSRKQCDACRRKNKERWISRIAAGLCANCGNEKNGSIDKYLCINCRTNRRATQTKIRQRLREKVLEVYGNKCACCNEREQAFLEVDHIENDGADHRRKLKAKKLYKWLEQNNWPKEGFQLLCCNCNNAKSRYSICPHQTQPKAWMPY